ncbi:MAG: hypothetical protein NTV30_08505, partial [Chloroflexi bacterium]|nr:hypothetical protein [Chloroflexota bacterium]
MKNPIGPYPGRQLFLGITANGKPTIAYLVTGRSPASRERKALLKDNGLIIGPIGNQPYDPLRHYTGIKYDNKSGIIVVSNGIQTEAIYEAYCLMYNTNSIATKNYMEILLDGAQAEPDSYHTPRIACAITFNNKSAVYIIGMKRNDRPAKAFLLEPDRGTLLSISTYDGDMENP